MLITKQCVKDALGWGSALWLFGYVLGIVLFFVVPPAYIGWVITPVGIAATLWVLTRRIAPHAVSYYLVLGTVWAIIAIVGDYFGIVRALHPADGYYKLDVYLYYALTFLLPLGYGLTRRKRV